MLPARLVQVHCKYLTLGVLLALAEQWQQLCVCVHGVTSCLGLSRGTWRAIRDHVQRSYLIIWEVRADHSRVPAISQS